MTTGVRLAAYGLALAAVFGAGAGLGALVDLSSADDAVEQPAPVPAPHAGTVGHADN